jgi:hypothetical protein
MPTPKKPGRRAPPLLVLILFGSGLVLLGSSALRHSPLQQKAPAVPQPPPLLQPPAVAANAVKKRKRRGRSDTVASAQQRAAALARYSSRHAVDKGLAPPPSLQTRRLNRVGNSTNSRSKFANMDLEAGVRIGSLCADGGPRDAVACPIAADVMKQLHAAVGDEPPEAALCIFTSLTEAYVEGHVLFMHEALRRSPMLREGALPLYVLDQALSPRGRARVTTVYGPTRWVERARERAKDASSVTKFALNKEKIALFGLRAACGSVLKLDTGDMLPLSDLSPMLTELSRRAASLPAHASLQAKQPPLPLPLPVWATQALGQPEGRINGGLMLFPRFWLHNATQSALARRAERESREQSLLGDFFGSELRMLPKRYNVEMRLWDAAHAEWR